MSRIAACSLGLLVSVLAMPQAQGDASLPSFEVARPWTLLSAPAEGSGRVVLAGPASRTLKLNVRLAPGRELRFPAGKRSRDRFLKREKDGRYAYTLKGGRATPWGPRSQVVLVMEGEAEVGRLELRAQGLRLLVAPKMPRGTIDKALAWMRRHQLPEGRLAATDEDFDLVCKRGGAGCEAGGILNHAVGLHALGMVTALRAGDGSEWVRRGLDWLVAAQDERGVFGGSDHPHFIYAQCLATEACALGHHFLGDPSWAEAAQKGIRYVADCRNRDGSGKGAWRYGYRPGENDASVTTWALRALYTCRTAGLKVDPRAIKGSVDWMWSFIDSKGVMGYLGRGEPSARPEGTSKAYPGKLSESLTAAALSVMLQAGTPRLSSRMAILEKSRKLVMACPPAWDLEKAARSIKEKLSRNEQARITELSSRDFYYWQHATYALKVWNATQNDLPLPAGWKKFPRLLAKQQHARGCKAGSFDPLDPWGGEAGRLYATASLALALANLEYPTPFVGEFGP